MFETLRRAGPRPVVAMATQLPGFVQNVPSTSSRDVQYKVLRSNVELLKPIQLGFSIGDADGSMLGTWSFNLHFDVDEDFHTEASVAMLQAAGVDFARHAVSGIEWATLGRRLRASPYLRSRSADISLVTFDGLCDLGYMYKMFVGKPLPADLGTFDAALESLCAHRCDLRRWCPIGSLDYASASRAVERVGVAHTVASDAHLILQIFHSCSGVMVAERMTSPAPGPPKLQDGVTSPPDSRRSSWGAAARAAIVVA